MAVRISQHLFVEMVTTGWESNAPLRCIEGVPPHSRLVNSFIEPEFGDAALVFYDESFAVVPDGERIPYLNVVFGTDYAEPSA